MPLRLPRYNFNIGKARARRESPGVLLILGLLMILGPLIMGLATKNLAGTVHSVEDGKLWFYRHGLGFLIGISAIVAAAYVITTL